MRQHDRFFDKPSVLKTQDQNTKDLIKANRMNAASQGLLRNCQTPGILRDLEPEQKTATEDSLTTFSTLLMPVDNKDKVVSRG